jgi:hypothetical protein
VKPILILIVLINLAVNYSEAQSVYITNQGYIMITGLYKGNTILAQSHKLNFILDYRTKEFTGRLSIRDLETGVETIDSLNKTNSLNNLLFTGTIPNDDFITWSHPQLNMEVLVNVIINNVDQEVIMNATLDHFPASPSYVCILNGSMEIELPEYNISIDGITGKVKVQLINILLRLQK